MRKVFEVFATRKGVDRSTLIFSLEDGTEIPDHETPRGIGLGNDGRINVLSLRQWVQNELDASRRQFHDHLQEQLDRLQEQLDSLQQKFMATSIKRDADDSNETENDAKRRRSK
jgi:Skp family chaperone for outer membrane proteins